MLPQNDPGRLSDIHEKKPVKLTQVKLDTFLFKAFHSPILTSDAQLYSPFIVNFTPARWFIYARLTAGYLLVYPGSGRAESGTQLRISSGEINLPIPLPSLSIETFSTAAGWFSVYALAKGMDNFDIKA